MILCSLFLRRSDPSGLQFWCGVGFCVGIGLFFYGFRLLQRRRLILDTPFSKIRSASVGMVEVSGLAVGPYTMIAPITAHPCYYYRTVVWEWKQRGKNKEWVKVAAECMHLPFYVDDNTGRMLVDPRGADLDLHCDFGREFSDSVFTGGDAVPDSVRSFLARRGIFTFNKLKVEEYCIKPKNSLFILGTLAENPGVEVSPRPVQESEMIPSVSSTRFSVSLGSFSLGVGPSGDDFEERFAQRMATRSDSPQPQAIRLSSASSSTKAAEMTQQEKIAAALVKAGISNPAAWAAAGVKTADAVDDSSSNGNGNAANGDTASPLNAFDAHPPVVLIKGTNNKTFLISWRSQQEVARSLGWKCSLMIWGGPLLALMCLYFFLSIRSLF